MRRPDAAVNILIFKLSPLGDTVMFLPVLQALRRHFPHWRITAFASPVAAELWRHHLPEADLIVIERAALQRAWRRPWQLARWLHVVRQRQPDAVLLSFDQSSVARFLSAASGARVRVAGAGATIKWQGGLTHEVPRETSASLADWEWTMAKTMAEALGHVWPTGPMPAPQLSATPTAPSRARPRIVVHAGASRDYQRWLPERLAELARRLSARADVVWVVRPEIAIAPPEGTQAFVAADLAPFVQLLSAADLFVGYHSGPFHLAAALGRPCLIIAGPSHPCCVPPWHRNRIRILRAPDLTCLPCDAMPVASNRCDNRLQPMACMRYWSVEAVEKNCVEMLDSSHGLRDQPSLDA